MKIIPGALLGVSMIGASYAEVMQFSGDDYRMVDTARYCFLPFIPVYDVFYYFNDVQTGKPPGACIKLVYKRELTAETLARATRMTFLDRHGELVFNEYQSTLLELDRAYLDVDKGSNYLFCLRGDEGVLLRNDEELLRLTDRGFARRYFQIWVDNPFEAKPVWNFSDCS